MHSENVLISIQFNDDLYKIWLYGLRWRFIEMIIWNGSMYWKCCDRKLGQENSFSHIQNVSHVKQCPCRMKKLYIFFANVMWYSTSNIHILILNTLEEEYIFMVTKNTLIFKLPAGDFTFLIIKKSHAKFKK